MVFHGFDIDACVAMSDEELEGLLLHEGIIRNRNKVFSVRSNAQVVQKIREEFSSFDVYIWSFINGKQIDGHGKALWNNRFWRSRRAWSVISVYGYKYVIRCRPMIHTLAISVKRIRWSKLTRSEERV